LLYSFEDFSLDTARRELRRGGTLIALQPQVFDLLDPGFVTLYRFPAACSAQVAGDETSGRPAVSPRSSPSAWPGIRG
jgi:hypothetical protein